MNQNRTTVYLTAAGDPVKALRELRSPEEWAIFREMRAKAKTWPYSVWKEWAVRNIVYAYSSKVAKQLGLQTPGKQVPSPLFYSRLRASSVDGTLQKVCQDSAGATSIPHHGGR